jgi:hypothetical protein
MSVLSATPLHLLHPATAKLIEKCGFTISPVASNDNSPSEAEEDRIKMLPATGELEKRTESRIGGEDSGGAAAGSGSATSGKEAEAMAKPAPAASSHPAGDGSCIPVVAKPHPINTGIGSPTTDDFLAATPSGKGSERSRHRLVAHDELQRLHYFVEALRKRTEEDACVCKGAFKNGALDFLLILADALQAQMTLVAIPERTKYELLGDCFLSTLACLKNVSSNQFFFEQLRASSQANVYRGYVDFYCQLLGTCTSESTATANQKPSASPFCVLAKGGGIISSLLHPIACLEAGRKALVAGNALDNSAKGFRRHGKNRRVLGPHLLLFSSLCRPVADKNTNKAIEEATEKEGNAYHGVDMIIKERRRREERGVVLGACCGRNLSCCKDERLFQVAVEEAEKLDSMMRQVRHDKVMRSRYYARKEAAKEGYSSQAGGSGGSARVASDQRGLDCRPGVGGASAMPPQQQSYVSYAGVGGASAMPLQQQSYGSYGGVGGASAMPLQQQSYVSYGGVGGASAVVYEQTAAQHYHPSAGWR